MDHTDQYYKQFAAEFFRSTVGFCFIMPLFWNNPLEPLRTRRFGMHFVRGVVGTIGNLCFFWPITHMVLADSMALQFSRPLFMIPLALMFLGEIAGWRRTVVTVVGFVGIALYARPFTSGFDPGAFIGAAGAGAQQNEIGHHQKWKEEMFPPRTIVV